MNQKQEMPQASNSNPTLANENDEDMLRAIAASLRKPCQFCPAVFENIEDLQLHQVNSCESISPKQTTTESSDDEDDVSPQTAKKEKILQANDLSIPSKQPNNVQKQSNETLVIDLQESAETLHETAIQVSPQQPNNAQKQSDDTLVVEVQESAETLHETTIQTYIQNNYTLNKSNALQKKRKCCDKPTYTVQERPNCTVVTLNTASFEFFREVLVTYLESNLDVYTVSHTPQTDQMNNVTQDILCITNNTTSAPM